MNRLQLTSKPHPAKRARRAVGVTSMATTVGIAGAIAVNASITAADEAAAGEQPATSAPGAPTTAPSLLSTNQAAIPAPTNTTTLTTTTTTTSTPVATPIADAPPSANPFGPTGALAELDNIVIPSSTTSTSTAPLVRRPAPTTAAPLATQPPATQAPPPTAALPVATQPPPPPPTAAPPVATQPPATQAPPPTAPPPPPTTVSGGS